jgi:Uma2 family endonuclease
MNAIPLEQEMEYPSSDGQPMAESPEHQEVMIDLIGGLIDRYAETPDVWAGGNVFLYYEKGNPKARVSPDVLMAKGVVKQKSRSSYLLWNEGPPSLIVEVTSLKTWRRDTGFKKSLYQRIGTEEYVLFDPLGEYLRPPLQGYRLLRGLYQPIPLEPDGSLLSRTTGLRLKREGYCLRMVDVITGEILPWRKELKARAAKAEARAAEEAAARQAADVRAAEEAAARQVADARAAEAEARAAEEAAARETLEDQMRALKEELDRFRKG